MKTISWSHFVEDADPFEGKLHELVQIDYELDYTYTPGDPGCRYTPNGDGWPPSPPEVEWTPRCVMLEWEDGSRRPTTEEAERASNWFEKNIRGTVVDDSIYEAVCMEEEITNAPR